MRGRSRRASAGIFRNLSFCESDSPARSKPSEFKFCLTECFLETTLNWLDQLKARRHPADEGSENIARFRQALMTNDAASRKAFAARQLRPTVF